MKSIVRPKNEKYHYRCEMDADSACTVVHSLPGYSVGDVLRAEDVDRLVDPNKEHVFHKNHCAFVRRSDGAYTYAVCGKTSGDGRRVTFVVDTSGNVKKISSSKCRGLVKLPILVRKKQKKSARTCSTSRSLSAREGPSIRVHRVNRMSSSLPPNSELPSVTGATLLLGGKDIDCTADGFARSDVSLFEGRRVKIQPMRSKKELTTYRNEITANLGDTDHLVSDAAICSQVKVVICDHLVSDAAICSQVEVEDELKQENRMLKKQVKHLQRLLEQRIERKVLGQSHSSPETDTTDELELDEYEACHDGMDFLRLQVLNQCK